MTALKIDTNVGKSGHPDIHDDSMKYSVIKLKMQLL